MEQESYELPKEKSLYIYKPFLHILGDRATILLSVLIYLDQIQRKAEPSYDYDGWFLASAKLLYIQTSQSEDTQRKSIQKLEEFGLIVKKRKGLPASNWFSIQYHKIIKLQESYKGAER